MLAPYRVIARAVILGRTDRGITQEQLGAALGTTGSAISRIESGTRPVTLDTLGRLGAALDITFVVGSPRAAPRRVRRRPPGSGRSLGEAGHQVCHPARARRRPGGLTASTAPGDVTRGTSLEALVAAPRR